jgi:hypothetical protein
MLEFGLTLPLMLLGMIMFLEFGRIVYYYAALNNAVREGARFAVVHPFDNNDSRLAAIRERVIGYAIGVPLDPNDVTAWCDGDPSTTGDATCLLTITVNAHMELSPMVGFTTRLLGTGTTFPINGESTMQMTPFGACEGCDATPTP